MPRPQLDSHLLNHIKILIFRLTHPQIHHPHPLPQAAVPSYL